ncbi:TetR/AcrR family transcriptional regulator [Shimia biformata]|uniref:TetR/AcrR family transcriptional regulator n=1 Tax=Shimia biformata TaxID=1294299 RepID=UPI00194FF86D|nr:TetR/AcrR family transcriptional regulator [Shimia biformata]
MNEMPAKLKQRAARKNAKRDEKKRRIAESAIEALKDLGYANTSLRDIADRSDLSLGMLHYYFEDRTDLIIYCVSVYKQTFVRTIAEALETADGRDQVIEVFSRALVESIFDDHMTHRLWYDIRTQAMFDETFRPVVAEIEANLMGLVRTAYLKAGHDLPEKIDMPYAMLDGAFQHLMRGQMEQPRKSHEELVDVFRALLGRFL